MVVAVPVILPPALTVCGPDGVTVPVPEKLTVAFVSQTMVRLIECSPSVGGLDAAGGGWLVIFGGGGLPQAPS